MFGKKKQELQKEIGSGAVAGTGVFGEWSDESNSLTRERRIHEYREMMKNATVSGLFNILTMPLLASEYDILPAEDSKEAKKQADFVRANLFEASFRGGMETPFDLFLDQAMLALLDGFAMFEKVYRLNNGHYEIAKLALRDSRSLEILKDEKGGYSGVKQTVGSESVVIPAYKTFLFTHNKKFDSLYGRSVFYGVVANYDKKRKLEYLDSIAIQNDAIKTKVLVETVEHSGTDQNFLSKVVGKLGNLGKLKSVAAIPHGYDLKTLDSNGRDPHQSIERQKSEMAFAVLANFMLLGAQGASSTGSYALSVSQAEIFQMSLQSVLDKLEAHINQFIIADLIELNFANPLYPTFKFSKIDKTATVAIYESFKTLLSKDKVSDEVIKQIEDSTATRLGLEISKGVVENRAHELSDSDPETPDKHFRNLDKKWKDLENRFLEVSRPIFERVAEDLAETAETTVKLPKEYKTILTEIFKQAYTEGKIFSANREGRKAGKNSAEFSKEAREYIDWIISKQEQDLASFLEAESVNEKLLADEDLTKELLKSALVAKISNWFLKRAKPTAGYLVGRGVNAGIYADFADEDLIEYSAILDGRTTAGCSYLDNKRMKWSEWKKAPDMIPPRHFGCRATLVRVVSGGDASENTPDLKKVVEKDNFQNATKKELIASGKISENETKKAALARIRNDEFVLPEKTKISPEIALSGTNPNYASGKEYQTNCQRCVPTYEMRRRGYDVEALGNFDKNFGNLVNIQKMWESGDQDMYLNFRLNKDTRKFENLNISLFKEYLKNIEPGERHQIGWVWRGREGHTIIVENVKGSLKFIDPQTSKIRNLKQFQDWTSRAEGMFWGLRIDDREISQDMLKLIMKGK